MNTTSFKSMNETLAMISVVHKFVEVLWVPCTTVYEISLMFHPSVLCL